MPVLRECLFMIRKGAEKTVGDFIVYFTGEPLMCPEIPALEE